MARIPNINPGGLSIPSGYVLGRLSPGTGQQELIPIGDLGRQLVAQAIIPPFGSPGSVTLTQPAAGLTITGGPSAFTFALANDLAAIEAMSSTGLVTRTASETYAQRTITGTADKITLTDGDGVAGNPTITIAGTYAGQTSLITLGTVTTGTWNAGSVASSTNGSGVYPTSTTTAGWAVTSNFGGVGEVDFWNTIDGEIDGFRFYQKTGASSAERVASLYHSSGYSELDFYSGGSVKASYGGSTTEGLAGTFANIPFNLYANSVNTVSLPAGGGIQIKGTTSGSVHLKVPAAAGSNTLTFPAGTTDFSATGGASQVVQQASAGAAFTVGQLSAAALSNGTTGTAGTAVVLATSPTLSTPVLGSATGTRITLTGVKGALVGDDSLIGAVQGALSVTHVNGYTQSRYSANATGPSYRIGKSRGSIATAAAVVAGDRLIDILAYGDDGSTNGDIPIGAAIIRVQAIGTISTGVVPAFVSIQTMNAAGTLGERVRFGAEGGFAVGSTTDPGSGAIMAATTIRPGGYTVATLPAAGTAGRIAYVTDALAPAYGAAAAGGGAVVTSVFDTGAGWVTV